jgi:RNA 3'-terminal phosphate cyclase (ATP)
MLAMAVLPLALFADGPSLYRITGGLFQDFAPPAFYFQHILLSVLRRMGVEAELTIVRPGYVPRGGGQIDLHLDPLRGKLRPIRFMEQGRITAVKGIALSSQLKDRRVSERMATACNKALASKGFAADIDTLYDEKASPVYGEPSPQAGAALMIWAETDSGCVIASDMAGARGRTSEVIGKKTAARLMEDIRTGATVDRHLADQLIPYAAFAEGKSQYRIPSVTDHVEARLWLIETFFRAKTRIAENRLEIEG